LREASSNGDALTFTYDGADEHTTTYKHAASDGHTQTHQHTLTYNDHDTHRRSHANARANRDAVA
jgi:hypothetical protein